MIRAGAAFALAMLVASSPSAFPRLPSLVRTRQPTRAVLPHASTRSLPRALAAACLTATLAACGDRSAPARDDAAAQPPATGAGNTAAGATSADAGATPVYTYQVVTSYPHDPEAFTQGLFVTDGQMYESTGLEGHSTIRRVDLATGRVLQRAAIDSQYFGEGIAAVGGRLYQLTWRNGKAFVYDRGSFSPRDTFKYTGEGWGLTTDGTSLVMSDGTARLRFLDPKSFAVQRTLDVHDGPSPVSQLNELEWVKGEIWANVWQSEQIARIDPKTGAVVGWIDLAGVLAAADRNGKEDVMNGIAYDAKRDKIYVTGKNWSRVYEIAIKRRS